MKTIQTKNSNHNPTPEQWAIWILWGIMVLWAMILISSCTTERKATNYMNNHAFAAANYCASAFPVRDSIIYKTGQTITKSDTTYLRGDSIACPPVDHIPEAGKLVYVKCSPSKIIHDSIFKTDTINVIRENTAKTAALTGQLAIITTKQKEAENGRRKWRQRALITWAICLIGIGGFTLTKFKIL